MIKLTNFSFEYPKNKKVFNNLNLQLMPGHIYGLLGENGVGKSTLLKSLAGLVFPTSGNVEVLNHQPKKRLPNFLQQIFIIPEEFNLPPVKIKRYVKTFAPFYPTFSNDLFYKLLKEFDIEAEQNLNEISYGQSKKVLIAFGLATQTPLVIMDEPTNGLDIPSKAQFRKIMASALTDERCFIISTHQVRDLDNLIDTLIILDDKNVALSASVHSITDILAFKNVPELPEDAIYTEQSLNGYNVIIPNTAQEETKLETELLFKAILLEKQKLTQLFNPKTTLYEQYI